MSFFGKSESELKKIAEDLEKLKADLDRRDSESKSDRADIERKLTSLKEAQERLDSERAAFLEMSKKELNDRSSENAQLVSRRIELTKFEAEAKTGFVETQREVFREVIEQRLAGLDQRQRDLEDAEVKIASRFKDLHAAEAEVASRALAVTEREQKADAGFFEKMKALADDAVNKRQAIQTELEQLRRAAEKIVADNQQIEITKAGLVAREQAIIEAEQRRDAGFADERSSFINEMQAKRAKIDLDISDTYAKRLSVLENEIETLKKQRLDEVSKAENAERERIQREISEERDKWTKYRDESRNQIDVEREELERSKGALHALQSELQGRRSELENSEKILERKDQRLEQLWQKRNQKLTDEVEARIAEEQKSMESERQSFKAEIIRLREGLRIQSDLVGAFDQLKRQLGDRDPVELLRDIASKTDEMKRLREELANRPTVEMRERLQSIEAEAKNQKARADALARQASESSAAIAEVAELRRKASELTVENKSLQNRVSIFEGAANEAQAELNRLRAAYERPAEVSARYKEIELPYIKADRITQPRRKDEADEISWLTELGNACDSYGLHFHPRILKAFHTALKTAEWSPITILAGVSGTGKSELPRLYSHFGGFLFEPLSVQPNWDSQESMLGFFNSIDNKFDAQPLLRFLAQSQKKWIERTNETDGYPGLQDAVCLVLLDEMNLAHPELYFAEFLSKLELRRGMKGSDVPSLPVKIGAGLPPYNLPLGRNVLWTGTMNQDETTKSLSDKVLDRSIVIHFPRPTELKRRLKLAPLDDGNRGALMHKTTWQSWIAKDSVFTDDDVKQYKCFIQDMNKALAVAGRAIGHRVWQSVEYYMANYPDVRLAQKNNDKNALDTALHVAFEDQLVQKVMPKLRGIDTRGKSMTECLEKIRDQINIGVGGNPFHIADDFNLACELGYGQFIWQSANYLADASPENSTAPSTSLDVTSSKSTKHETVPKTSVVEESKPGGQGTDVKPAAVLPPKSYMPNDPNRIKAWERLPESKKQLYLLPKGKADK